MRKCEMEKMRKNKYIVPTTERVTLKMYQNVMDDFDYGDANVTSTEDLITAATKLVRMENKASITLLQRRLKIGYARAARIMQALEDLGVVGPYNGSEPRAVLPVDVPAEG